MQPSKQQIYILFSLVIIIWGCGWPISKIGVAIMTPFWYASARVLIGAISVLVILIFTKTFKFPRRQDFPMILNIGILHVAVFQIMMMGGLQYVQAGRSSILAYTITLWASPMAIIFFHERVTRLKITGLLLALVGIVILFNPIDFDWSDHKAILGNAMLLFGAFCWALGLIFTRYGTWHSPPFVLLPWQLLLGAVLITLFAFLSGPLPTIEWNIQLMAVLFYIGVLATAFGYWGSIYVNKSLPVVTSSLCSLAIPVVGLLSSAWMLGESLSFTLIFALTTIMIGIALVILGNRTAR